MYTDCIASSSRFTVQDYWDPQPAYWAFPVSDCRSEASLGGSAINKTSNASQYPVRQAQILPSLSLSPSSHSTQVPLRSQISHGVWSDGKDTVFSSALPEVQQLLAKARATLELPTPSSELIFTLAALDVFYKPGDPAHWMFWSDDRKNATADVVTRISLHRPPLIQSPIAWNGKPEYLSILASHHGTTWRQVYENQAWFTILVPPKPTTPPRSLNLRKRKVPPGAFREPSRSPGLDEEDAEETQMSQPKTSRAPTPEQTEGVDPPTMPLQRNSSSRLKARQATPSPVLFASSYPAPAHDVTSFDTSAGEPRSNSSRNKRKRRKISPPSRYLKLISSREASSSPVEPSALAMVDSVSPHPAESPVLSHSRNRSISTVSSAKTVVASDESRGTSVVSGMTAIETLECSKKRKTLGVDVIKANEATRVGEDGGIELNLIVVDGEEEGMVTRGRSSRARVVTGGLIQDPDGADIVDEKSGVTSSRSVRKRARRP